MSYPVLTLQAAQAAYDQLKQSIEPAWPELEALRGGGPPKDYYGLKEDAEAITECFTFPLSDGAAAKYEGEIGVMLHESVTDQEAIADPDFWRYVALRPLLNATLSRHQTGDREMPKPANFGIGSQVENFAFRAWMRADIGYERESQPSSRYRLALRGDQDLWRSHLIRVRYSYHREMAHAMIEFQYPTDESDGVLQKGNKDDGIRLLAKKLQRTQANLAYSMLSKEQCTCLIHRLAAGLKRVDGGVFSTTGAS